MLKIYNNETIYYFEKGDTETETEFAELNLLTKTVIKDKSKRTRILESDFIDTFASSLYPSFP